MEVIRGGCHCGVIRYELSWPLPMAEIPVRACGCSFCRKHDGTYTSHRDAVLMAVISNAAQVSDYTFGTGTAEFKVCSRCGVVPFVTSEILGTTYAVVNVNTFNNVDPARFERASTDFEGETLEDRLARRRRSWIPNVTIRFGG